MDNFLEISGEKFDVLYKCIFHPKSNSLILGDLHLGKSEHFRKSGISVPADFTSETLNRLQEIIQKNQPETVIFLGDLFHSKNNKSLEVFLEFLKENNSVNFILVGGNHDKSALPFLPIKILQTLEIGNLILSHEPMNLNAKYNICAHIHPAVILKGKGKQKLTLPCIWSSPNQTILPAFGSFTGNYPILPSQGDTVFVFGKNGEIFRV